jgi:hypothetical protein
MIDYFISYLFQGARGIAAANCKLTVPCPITSMHDIRAITAELTARGISQPVVMGYTRLDDAHATSVPGMRR